MRLAAWMVLSAAAVGTVGRDAERPIAEDALCDDGIRDEVALVETQPPDDPRNRLELVGFVRLPKPSAHTNPRWAWAYLHAFVQSPDQQHQILFDGGNGEHMLGRGEKTFNAAQDRQTKTVFYAYQGRWNPAQINIINYHGANAINLYFGKTDHRSGGGASTSEMEEYVLLDKSSLADVCWTELTRQGHVLGRRHSVPTMAHLRASRIETSVGRVADCTADIRTCVSELNGWQYFYGSGGAGVGRLLAVKFPGEWDKRTAAEHVAAVRAEQVINGERALPAGWSIHQSRSQPGKFYYAHEASGHTQWERPPSEVLDPLHKGAQQITVRKGKHGLLGLALKDGRVTEVTPGGPAEAAGLEVGDTLTEMNGRTLPQTAWPRDLVDLLHRSTEIHFTVRKDVSPPPSTRPSPVAVPFI